MAYSSNQYGTLKEELIRNKIVPCCFFVRQEAAFEKRETSHSNAPMKSLPLTNSPTETTPSSSSSVYKDEVHSIGRGEKVFLSKEASKPDVRKFKNCCGDHPAKLKSGPAFGRKFLHCGKPNHFENVCKSF